MSTKTREFFLERFSSRQAWAVLLGYVALMIAAGFLLSKYVDRETLRATVQSYGSGGILVFLLIEFLFVVFVPFYNTPIHLAAGYIFGGPTGWLINFIATTAGLFTIIALVKYFGRPLLNRVVPGRILSRYDSLVQNIGPIALFVAYVLPLFPDDEITYMIAASRPVHFWRFVAPVVFGNITKAAVSYIGDEGSRGVPMAVGTRFVVLGAGLILIATQEFLFRRSRRLPDKQNESHD